MDIGIIGGVLTLPAFEKEFGISSKNKIGQANLSANIVSVMQAGAFAGALIANPVADRFGRRPGLICAASFCAVGAAMQAGSTGAIACLYVGRYEYYLTYLSTC